MGFVLLLMNSRRAQEMSGVSNILRSSENYLQQYLGKILFWKSGMG
jgi:hypothetical protein